MRYRRDLDVNAEPICYSYDPPRFNAYLPLAGMPESDALVGRDTCMRPPHPQHPYLVRSASCLVPFPLAMMPVTYAAIESCSGGKGWTLMGTPVRWRSLSVAIVGALLWTALAVVQTRPALSAPLSGEASTAIATSVPQTCQSTPVARVLRTVGLGNAGVVGPVAVAVDAQTSRAFVATQPYSVTCLTAEPAPCCVA